MELVRELNSKKLKQVVLASKFNVGKNQEASPTIINLVDCITLKVLSFLEQSVKTISLYFTHQIKLCFFLCLVYNEYIS